MRVKELLLAIILSAAAASAGAEMIDELDSASDISSGSDGTASVTAFVSTTPAHVAGISGVRLSYDLTSGSYVYMERKYQGVDMTNWDAIRFYYKGTGAANNIEFKLIDGDGDIWIKTYSAATNTNGVWNSITVMFSALSKWTVNTGALDLGNISKIEIAISKNEGGSGAIAFDKMQLLLVNTPSTILANDCNSNTNSQGNTTTVWLQNSGVDTMTYTIESGTQSAKGDSYYAVKYGFNIASVNGADVLVNILKTYSGGVVVSSLNATGMNYVTFYLRGESGGEKPRFCLQYWGSGSGDNIGRPYVKVWNYKAVTTSWQFYSIPLSDFTGLNLATIVEGNFEFNQADGLAGGSSGKIFIDELRFSATQDPSASAGSEAALDNMEDGVGANSAWSTSADNDVSVEYSNTAGLSDSALQASYTFKNNGTWFVIYRSAGKNIANSKGLRFKYAGTGSSNNLEFKITDTNKVTYFRKFYSMTNTNGKWKTISIPLKEFAPFDSGSTASLNLKSIKTFNFAVSKNAGGTGDFCVADLEMADEADFEANTGGFLLLESFSILNNPISPNGDGFRDRARFSYMLKDSAAIKLEIYNLDGSLVYESEKDDTYDGTEHYVEWSAVDSGGSRVNNGLYLYKFTAKGYDNQEDKITHVIGVIR